jgi:hypothetical protein
MGTIFVDNLEPQSGTSLTLGASGDTITIPSGATITNSGTATGFGGIFESQLLHVRDEKSAGTQGGSGTSGYNTRDLNTVKTNEITGASLSSNQITLPSGTYYATAFAMTRRSNQNKIRLYNTTDSSTALLGNSNRSGSGDVTTNTSLVSGRFTISAQKVFELQHYFDHNDGSTSLKGEAVSGSDSEVYVDVQIWKVA